MSLISNPHTVQRYLTLILRISPAGGGAGIGVVKLRVAELGGKPLWALKIAFRIVDGEEELHELLQTVLESCDHSEPPTTLND